MARKHHQPEEIAAKLRQVDVLTVRASRSPRRWRRSRWRRRRIFAGGRSRAAWRTTRSTAKGLELENTRLRRAVSDLTLDKLILAEAARGNF